LSVLKAADALFDSSINDGWNLQPFMFYCAHSEDKLGVAIVSEFIGCSCFLTGAKKVNPWHTNAMVQALHETVEMPEEDRQKRFSRDHSYISGQTLTAWIHQNLSELKQTTLQIGEPTSGILGDPTSMTKADGFRHLSINAVLADYRNSRCRAIFLDNEGTLAPEVGTGITPYGNLPLRKDGNALDPKVMDCLRLLAKDPLNSVVVISGRSPEFLDRVGLSQVEGLGLCAEYGFYYQDPGRIEKASRAKGGGSEGSDRWKCSSASTTDDADWKEIVFELMKMYAKRVQGSIIEYKGAAISWNYREVGAQILAKEMALQLMRFLDPEEPDGLMRGYPVTVAAGKGYVEVGRSDINKGISVKRMLAEIQQHIGNLDFVLCIGDDRSDEHMFEAVSEYRQSKTKEEKRSFNASTNSLGALSSPRFGDGDGQSLSGAAAKQMSKKASMTIEALEEAEKALNQRFYTVTVGRKRSKAGYFVQDVSNVSELLTQLTAQTTKAQFSRFQSMPNLAGAGSPELSGSDED